MANLANDEGGVANSRIPPGWCVENDRKYPLRYYRRDLEIWNASTDLIEERRGPAASMRITGVARDMVREIPIGMLTQGHVYPEGNFDGLGVLLRALERRYGALDQEVQVHSISELMSFSRIAGESTDSTIARFDVLLHRANYNGGVAFGAPLRAWMILTHLQIPKTAWSILLVATQGMLPTDDAQYLLFAQALRRNGHLHDRTGGDNQRSIAQPFLSVEQPWPGDPATAVANQVYHVPGQNNLGWPSAYPSVPVNSDDNMSWHSFSTGNSDHEEPLAWSSIENALPLTDIGEHLYLEYRSAKRKWRNFAGKGRKRHKGKGRGKGKGKFNASHTGKGPNPRQFWIDDFGQQVFFEQPAQLPVDEPVLTYVFKGRGKGNPIGKDGKVMTCSICSSPEHFRMKCPKGDGKGNRAHFTQETTEAPRYSVLNPQNPVVQSEPSVSLEHLAPPVELFQSYQSVASASASAGIMTRPMYFAQQTPAERKAENYQQFMPPENTSGAPRLTYHTDGTVTWESRAEFAARVEQRSRIFFEDGSASMPLEVAREDHIAENVPSFAWWNHAEEPVANVFHSQVRLTAGEALLIDTGAVKNLTGEVTIRRMQALAQQAGQGTDFQDMRSILNVDGVGAGSSSCSKVVTVPIVLSDGRLASYKAPMIDGSEVPPLLGLESMKQHRVLLDLVHNKFIMVGQGGFDLKLSPGSTVLQMQKAKTGHLMLPASEWSRIDRQQDEIDLTAIQL